MNLSLRGERKNLFVIFIVWARCEAVWLDRSSYARMFEIMAFPTKKK